MIERRTKQENDQLFIKLKLCSINYELAENLLVKLLNHKFMIVKIMQRLKLLSVTFNTFLKNICNALCRKIMIMSKNAKQQETPFEMTKKES